MKISYDPEIDSVYIRLIEGQRDCRTLRLNDEIPLNIGANEKLVGIEILDAKAVLAAGKLPQIAIENLPFAAASGLRWGLRQLGLEYFLNAWGALQAWTKPVKTRLAKKYWGTAQSQPASASLWQP